MRLLRTSALVACAFLACALGVPASALAAAAPALVSPTADAGNVTTGSSMKFEWTGALGGHADAVDRSFFRIELIAAARMPAGAQTAWDAADLENFVQTEPGVAATSASLGVPAAGEYKWRVCAWGVVDPVASNTLQQLPGGCSATRTFTSVAAATDRGAIGELPIENRTTVTGGVKKVFVERPAPPADPEPIAEPEPIVEEAAPVVPTRVQEVVRRDVGEKGSALALGGGTAFDADSAADREGIGGAVMTGLNTSLPFLPIPFWTLAMLIAIIPLARAWRRNVLAMFDWPDGSINGHGIFAEAAIADSSGASDSLQFDARTSTLQVRSTTADGEATAPASTGRPARNRQAA